MSEIQSPKRYDLEERTLNFAKRARELIRKLPKTLSHIEDGRQLARSSGSIGANYIEANESLSRKDFVMRIKICRKEAKETRYWLKLIECKDDISEREQETLIREAAELTKIFGSILEKSK